ncbi:hypothetical protein RQP46_000683 [Phenoliferia psychrophenolica]
MPSAPPPHFLAENPSYHYPSSPPTATVDIHSRSSSADPGYRSASPASGGRDSDPDAKGRLTFAPLPPGRRAYRSNSLSIGVAARAQMIHSQGAGPRVAQPRYAGPQQWYQQGGTVPPDVYTYKDVQKGVSKMWQKVRRRSSVSSSAAEAAAMERDGKGKSKEIEHIEEASDEEDSADEDAIGSDGSEERGRPHNAFGLRDMDDRDSPSSTPDRPGGSIFVDPASRSSKGKGVADRTPTGVAL